MRFIVHSPIPWNLWHRTQRATAIALFAAIIAGGAQAQDLTLEQVIAKNENAVGGSDAIKQVRTLRLTTNTILESDPAKVTMTTTLKRPNLMRIDTFTQGRAVASGFDGSSAWIVNPATGTAEPMNLEKTASGTLVTFQIDGVLGSVGGILVGQQTRLIGVEVVQGNNAYHIQGTRGDGIVSDYYLDQTTFLIAKSAVRIPKETGEQMVESYPADYRKVNGLMIAYSLDIKIAGQSVFQKQIQQVEVNPSIDDNIFKMPSFRAK